MKWRIDGDDSAPIITAAEHVAGSRSKYGDIALPETCVMFEMSAGLPHIEANYACSARVKLPCFLTGPEYIMIDGMPDVCFVRGGFAAPCAADTLETLRVLGVKQVIVAGMCGGFGGGIRVGDIVLPERAYCEEGTSLHYYEQIEYAEPDKALHALAKQHFGADVLTAPIVTTDAVYRQTWLKESVWREKGCVCVDMETSALLSVARYYGMPAVAVHICSDRHPEKPGDDVWKWGSDDFRARRTEFFEKVISFAGEVSKCISPK